MAPVNIRKELYERAIRAKITSELIVEIANDAVEKYLDDHGCEQ